MTAMPALPARLAIPLADLFAACLVLLAVGWALSVQRKLGLDLYPQQFFAGVLFFALPLAFLTLPATRGTDRIGVPIYDLILAGLSMGALGYVAVKYPDLVLMIFARPPELWIPSLIIIVLLLETLRRATGWALVIIISAFLLYALFGDLIPGRLQGRPQNWQLLSGYLAVDSNGVLGLPMSVAATVVIAFILFACFWASPAGRSSSPMRR